MLHSWDLLQNGDCLVSPVKQVTERHARRGWILSPIGVVAHVHCLAKIGRHSDDLLEVALTEQSTPPCQFPKRHRLITVGPVLGTRTDRLA